MKRFFIVLALLLTCTLGYVKMASHSHYLRNMVEAKYLDQDKEEGIVAVAYEVRDKSSYKLYTALIPMKYVFKEGNLVIFDKKILANEDVQIFYEETSLHKQYN